MALRAFWPPVKFTLSPAEEAALEPARTTTQRLLPVSLLLPVSSLTPPSLLPAKSPVPAPSQRLLPVSLLLPVSSLTPPSLLPAKSPVPAPSERGRLWQDNAASDDPEEEKSGLEESSSSTTNFSSSRSSQSFDMTTSGSAASKKSVPSYTGVWALLKAIYHKYGMNHLLLLIILAVYSCIGAGVFVWCERPAQELRLAQRSSHLMGRRKDFVNQIFAQIFNDTARFLLFIDKQQSREIETIMQKALVNYEKESRQKRGPPYDEHDLLWDFGNAILYSWTLVTTIGYGHLYPLTEWGKITTMIYAIFGIPLMLLVLNDLGKLLTKLMK